MRQLLLLRHAKSSWDDPALPDHARPLNARGRRAAAAMAGTMRNLGLRPDHVLVSSARRTLQTLEALAPLDPPPRVAPTDDLYLAPWPRLLDALRELPEAVATALLIGHNPGLHDLALALTGEGAGGRLSAAYPTAALAVFEVRGPWSSLSRDTVALRRFLAPSDLPHPAA